MIMKTRPCNIFFFSSIKIEVFMRKSLIFLNIFAQNIECRYMMEPPCQGSSNDYQRSTFCSKIRKIGIPLHTPFLLYKSGVFLLYKSGV